MVGQSRVGHSQEYKNQCVHSCVCDHASSEVTWGMGFLPLLKVRLVSCDAGTLRFQWLGSYNTNVHNIILCILS
jgi:hypothetical protein